MIRSTVGLLALVASIGAHATTLVISDDGKAADRAIEVTKKYELTTDKIECLLFDTFDKGSYYIVRVRENHTEACGGARETDPALYYLKIRKRDGATTTDAYNLLGHFERLKPPTKK